MRAQGLGVVLAVGEDSKFKVGDHVTGAWGACSQSTTDFALDSLCCIGMTEYAVVPDQRLEKLEYVIFMFSCSFC